MRLRALNGFDQRLHPLLDRRDDFLAARPVVAEHLKDKLGWESVYAWNDETFGPTGTLGRKDATEAVLTRDLRTTRSSPPSAHIASSIAGAGRSGLRRVSAELWEHVILGLKQAAPIQKPC
jgi:hypothetical protein